MKKQNLISISADPYWRDSIQNVRKTVINSGLLFLISLITVNIALADKNSNRTLGNTGYEETDSNKKTCCKFKSVRYGLPVNLSKFDIPGNVDEVVISKLDATNLMTKYCGLSGSKANSIVNAYSFILSDYFTLDPEDPKKVIVNCSCPGQSPSGEDLACKNRILKELSDPGVANDVEMFKIELSPELTPYEDETSSDFANRFKIATQQACIAEGGFLIYSNFSAVRDDSEGYYSFNLSNNLRGYTQMSVETNGRLRVYNTDGHGRFTTKITDWNAFFKVTAHNGWSGSNRGLEWTFELFKKNPKSMRIYTDIRCVKCKKSLLKSDHAMPGESISIQQEKFPILKAN